MIHTYETINYLGAALEVQSWIKPLWPYDMPFDNWPTFCGAGDGPGDWLVPDGIDGADISPACLVHDLDFATLPRKWWPFQQANNRLYCNIIALIDTQIVDKQQLADAYKKARRYWFAVSLFGWFHFSPESENPWQNSIVRDRLNRLAKAQIGKI